MSTDKFLKTVLWLYCDNQPFSSPNGPFFEPYRAEMKIWSPRLFFFIHVSVAQRHKFLMGKIGQRTRNKKKRKNSIIRMSSFPLYDSMHGQYVNSSDGFATIEFFFK